jgi:hypothetical protein
MTFPKTDFHFSASCCGPARQTGAPDLSNRGVKGKNLPAAVAALASWQMADEGRVQP